MPDVLSDSDIRRLALAIADQLRTPLIREELNLLDVDQVAELLHRSPRWVLDELRDKRLRGSKYGGAWAIKAADLDAYIEARMNLSRIRRRRL